MKPITETDLEIEYHSSTGNEAYLDGKITRGYTRGFYDWCLEQLIIERNKKPTEPEATEFFLKDDDI